MKSPTVKLGCTEWATVLSALVLWDKYEGQTGTKASEEIHARIEKVDNKILKQLRRQREAHTKTNIKCFK